MDVHCPTCGQECSNRIAEQLEAQAMEIRELFWSRKVHLTQKEARILGALRGKNRPVSKAAIMDQLYWDDPNGGALSKTIDVFVCKLRPKIKKSKLPWNLVTIWGLGYELREEETKPKLIRTACALMVLLPLGQVILSRLP